MTESTLAERMRNAMDALHLTQKEVAQVCGLKQPSVAKWLSGDSKTMNASAAMKLAKFLGVNPRWLIEGIGNKNDIVLDPNVIPAPKGTKRVPVLAAVEAGHFRSVGDLNYNEYIIVDEGVSDDTFALRIRGASMEPEYLEGDLIVVDPALEPHPGDNVVAQTNNDEEATFKKYRIRNVTQQGQVVFDLVPLNPDYPTFHSDLMPIRIIGVEIEHRRYKRRK